MRPVDIPPTHPRYASLMARHKLTEAYEAGILATAGLIAHGRGEAFDYIIGEETIPAADDAELAAACYLFLAEKPAISVNGNVAVLCAKDIAELATLVRARIEVNLFYWTQERMEKIVGMLEDAGAQNVLGLNPDFQVPGLDHQRAKCCSEGIGRADVVFVPLEDGDRCQALVGMGKKVLTVDLNPLSRTSQSATVSIMDEVTRALNGIMKHVKKLRWTYAEKYLSNYDNNIAMSQYLDHINTRLSRLSEEKKRFFS
ncbi:MAG: 4-phosphopantoate--beta-alanine ligase [Candidatus Thermoplasmatota archaeon]|nr:4-phosphopantoate--beta-alanine ligase [Candidatus Thermoplasmatota archaeon]